VNRHLKLTGTIDVYFVSVTVDRYNRRIHKIHYGINKMIILPIVLYVCENWPFVLRLDHRVRLLKNRVLRKTLEPKSDNLTGE
jgi:hypothetical protein